MTKPIIPEAALGQHIAVLGKTGAGKSSVIRWLVESLLDQQKPVCIIDPKGDWWGLKSSADGKHPGYPVVIFGGEHADVPLNPRAGAHVAELVATGNRPCIIDLGGWMVGDRTRFFIDFASTLFRHTKGPRWLVIDEVHNFAPQGKVIDPDAGKMLHWSNRMASEGRGKGVTLIAASQRPQKVHKDFLTSCETLVAMRVIHPLDRGAIKDWIDGCPDAEKGKEVLGSLASMPRGTGWVWSPEIGFGPLKVAFPMFRTYDSFKPQAADAGKLKGWAEVDLEDVKARLADAVKEAEANDPRLLRVRISDLERELKKGHDAGPTPAWRAEYEQAHARDTASAHADGKLEGWSEAIAQFEPRLHTAGMAIEDARRIAKSVPPVSVRASQTYPKRKTPDIQLRPPQSPQRASAGHRGNGSTAPAAGLTSPEQRILNAIAWMESIGVAEPEQTAVAFLSRYSGPDNGAYKNPRGALHQRGLVRYAAPGRIALTDEGRLLAQAPDSPATTEELQQRILDRLPGPERKLLAQLISVYPNGLSNDDLAQACNYSDGNNGAYKNPRGRLRTLGLIDYPRPGHVVALPVLFI